MADKKDEKPKPKAEKAKKKWVKPSLRTGKLFEVNSLSCGKASGMTGQCSTSAGMS